MILVVGSKEKDHINKLNLSKVDVKQNRVMKITLIALYIELDFGDTLFDPIVQPLFKVKSYGNHEINLIMRM